MDISKDHKGSPKTPMMLITDIAKLFSCQMRRQADQIGVPSGYRHILVYLAHNEGINQLELAKITHLAAPTVCVTLQKMENDGFIIRKPCSKDARHLNIFLTDNGKKIERRMKQAADNTEKLTFDSFTESEKTELSALLLRAYERLYEKENNE